MAYSLIISAYPDSAVSVDVLDRVNAEVIAGQDVLRNLTPDSGIYVNEATKKYDPDVVLYGPGFVGSDYWTVASDGRLCQATELSNN
ncbi:uncharacterized protein TRUGW13939_01389 [Talaromyces rugulosus]|uniref:Uncharacterized protein n=1 Tax=Talaromyces rugulosus TaxID=121627 RepID=A0A7H8QM99_TALRU|nr:uncharacterized protein TRUGW13939_01389 [Talaromyces rugulosus]QKX54303.1 hypothetical protein TRUGW13939_01389 [Talaromyces rugulosus]